MGFKLYLLTHTDIKPIIKKEWVESKGRKYFYLKNGFKSSASNVLLPIGVLGLWEWWINNPVFRHVFGDNGFIISLLAVLLGLSIIWICDRVYEHHLLVQAQKTKDEQEHYNNELESIKDELSNLKQASHIDNQAYTELLKRLDNMMKSEVIIEDKGLENTLQRFIKDLSE